jgi:hypothetical protein
MTMLCPDIRNPGFWPEKTNIYMRSVIHMPLRKIMRAFFIPVVAIAVLISACLFCACVSQKPDTQVPVMNITPNVTTPVPTPEPDPTQSPYISLEDARNRLGDVLDTDPKTNPDRLKNYKKSGENITILFIQGVNADTSGNARLWAFGTRTRNGTQLRAYDRSGWTVISLNDSISSDVIIADQVISPATLLEKNNKTIFSGSLPDAELRTIHLQDGIYSVTLGQDHRTMRFNATTGAPIDSYS